MNERFGRTEMIFGAVAMDTLKTCHVAVFGLGGVGGYTVEALARTGIGQLDLIDSDTVSLSNLNRQILATYDTIGRDKTEVAAERIRSINPACRVEVKTCFYLPETEEQFDFSAYDYVVDAVDTVTAKISLEPHKLYGGRRGPVLYATEYAMTSAPKQEVATFY